MFAKTEIATEKAHRRMPELVRSICMLTKGFIVGSAVDWVLAGNDRRPITYRGTVEMMTLPTTMVLPRDWDIIVPPAELAKAIMALKVAGGQHSFNSFGGIKYSWFDQDAGEQLELDVWGSTLEDYLLNARASVPGARLYRPFGGLQLTLNNA